MRFLPSALCLPVAAAIVFTASLAPAQPTAAPASAALAWPTPTQTMRPWTRWWWLGSAVDEPNLNRLLTDFQAAGLGGVEICPIYGAKGYESRFIDYLSPKWMDMLAAATRDAHALGLGVDLTTGTGWPMGGPWITNDHASGAAILKRYTLAGGARLTSPLPAGNLQYLLAVDANGQQVDLTAHVDHGTLDWTAPAGTWKLYALAERQPVQKVKRAAPGGAGNVLDPFSTAAMDQYLARFDDAFKDYHEAPPRAEFHDSYEYFAASWTPEFFAEFLRRRGYDLRSQLPAFFGDGDPDTVARVKFDYRATIADLHQAYIARWTEWAHRHGSVTREQAHGSPTNLEDVYATADIPETEGSFGGVLGADEQIPMMQFASSAAHVTGRTLASSETFTWLGEHFQVPLARLKPTADFFFLAGINHIFFHGIPYSPADAPWPGWLFYAAVNLGPEGGIWHDLPAFTAYATRCQSILQSGEPANDLLLYFPVADYWQKGGDSEAAAGRASATSDTRNGLIEQFTTPGKWMEGTPFHDTAMALVRRGYSYDIVTDHFVATAQAGGGTVQLGGHPYRAILLPPTQFLPVETLQHLLALADGGATILVQGDLPADVPGWNQAADRRSALAALTAGLSFQTRTGTGLREARVGQGLVLVDHDLNELLAQAAIPREPMWDSGLRTVRRKQSDGYDYFIVNSGTTAVDGWVSFGTPVASAVLFDPMFSDHVGVAAVRRLPAGGDQVFLQLQPGESRIVRTYAATTVAATPWTYERPAHAPVAIAGPWSVHFTQGGPALPTDYATPSLASWTDRDDVEAKRFSGSAVYRTEFDFQPGSAADWLLDLGTVCESARVRLNGHDVTTLWCAPFATPVGAFLQAGHNVLEVEVTNVAANRIADLDRRHVNWKSFYEINFVNHDYRPFDASKWPERPSGLLGPVTLTALAPAAP